MQKHRVVAGMVGGRDVGEPEMWLLTPGHVKAR
jgi:hypothetical protein